VLALIQDITGVRHHPGDTVFTDLDLSARNLPIGTQLKIGPVVLEISDVENDACAKFAGYRKTGLSASVACLPESSLADWCKSATLSQKSCGEPGVVTLGMRVGAPRSRDDYSPDQTAPHTKLHFASSALE
jgi:hypothetical protein